MPLGGKSTRRRIGRGARRKLKRTVKGIARGATIAVLRELARQIKKRAGQSNVSDRYRRGHKGNDAHPDDYWPQPIL